MVTGGVLVTSGQPFNFTVRRRLWASASLKPRTPKTRFNWGGLTARHSQACIFRLPTWIGCGMYAATLRIEALEEINSLPDAVKNVLGIVKRLTKVHSDQLQKEGYPWTDADRAAAAQAEKQLKEAWEALRKFQGGDDPDES